MRQVKKMEEAKLLYSEMQKDEDGFAIEKKVEIEICVLKEKSIVRTEFYDALRSGISPQIVLEIRQEDFDLSLHKKEGQIHYADRILYEGQIYNIIRTYKPNKSKIELTCA